MSRETLDILDALENLNTLLEAESLTDLEVTEEAKILSHKGEQPEEIQWIQAGRDEWTLLAIKKTFASVFDYLQRVYQQHEQKATDPHWMEGLSSVIVLVGEAAKKVDSLGVVFKEKITDSEEYKAIEAFYKNHILKALPQGSILLPQDKIRAAIQGAVQEEAILPLEEEVVDNAGVHQLDDLDVVKKDHLYELFYIKNEEGQPFYSSFLSRRIKLACDFGELLTTAEDDPLVQIKNWQDKSLHLLSKKLLTFAKKEIEKFYKEALRHKEQELVGYVHNSLMALMMASNSKNLLRQYSQKGCFAYFSDFQMYLRHLLHHRDYQKLIVYPPPATSVLSLCMAVAEKLCLGFFTLGADQAEIEEVIAGILKKEGVAKAAIFSQTLTAAQQAFEDLLNKHPSGPVFKALDLIREEESNHEAYDPLEQGNIPTLEAILKINSKDINLVRMPCPVRQDHIQKAAIGEEFKTYLFACSQVKGGWHHLLVNFQDRTSWREHARSVVLEDLSKNALFSPVLTVVTLSKDTDFYNQTGLYESLEDAEEFCRQFYDHLSDESAGSFFPVHLKKAFFPEFSKTIIQKVHKVFFNLQDTLSVRERLDFIELTYQFLVLKLMETLVPPYLSLTSKDGLDLGGPSTVCFLSLLRAFQEKPWTEEEQNKLLAVFYGQTLLLRERPVLHERFERIKSVLGRLEKAKGIKKAFSDLYQPKTLQAEITFPL